MGKKIVNQKSVLIQTKISPAIDSRLDRICKEYGFSSKYELLQNLVSAFLKYADPESGEQDISESDRFSLELAKIFTELQNKGLRINRVSSGADKSYILSESIQLYQRPGKHGIVGVKYTFGKDGELVRTENSSKILKSVIGRLFPQMYRRLSSLCLSLGGVALDDAISYLMEVVDHRLLPDHIEREIKEEFNGQSVAEKHVDMTGDKPKRRRDNSISI